MKSDRREGDSAIYSNPNMVFIEHSLYARPCAGFSENADDEEELFDIC